MFSGCESLECLPDLSKWNTSNIKNMKEVFQNCLSLKVLPDISKWQTENVEDMSKMFENCISLKVMPNISVWKTLKVKDITNIFYKCESLINIPDISNWNFCNISRINNNFIDFTSSNSSLSPSILNNYLSEKNFDYTSSLSNDDKNLVKEIFKINDIKVSNGHQNDLDKLNDYYDNFYS